MVYKLKPNGILFHPLKCLRGCFQRQIFTKLPVNYFRNCSTVNNGTKEDSKSNLVVVEQVDNVRIIGINRPEKRNCINNATAKALLQAFKDFDADENSKAAVLYGVGGNFCAGYDLEEISSTPDLASKIDPEMGPMGPTWYETSKPVIAAIQGYAVAGGLELALWCDIRVVEETAIMGVFCRRFGVPLIDGGTVRLPAIVGLGRALDLILTGRPIRAPEALSIGLTHHVVACGAALGRALVQAQAMLLHPQEALKADRYSARCSVFAPSLEVALKEERARGLQALKEAQIGAKEFMGGKGRHGSFRPKKEEAPSNWQLGVQDKDES